MRFRLNAILCTIRLQNVGEYIQIHLLTPHFMCQHKPSKEKENKLGMEIMMFFSLSLSRSVVQLVIFVVALHWANLVKRIVLQVMRMRHNVIQGKCFWWTDVKTGKTRRHDKHNRIRWAQNNAVHNTVTPAMVGLFLVWGCVNLELLLPSASLNTGKLLRFFSLIVKISLKSFASTSSILRICRGKNHRRWVCAVTIITSKQNTKKTATAWPVKEKENQNRRV